MPNPETRQFIERMGLAMDRQGLTRTFGRVFGLLMVADEPLSLDDMVERLQALSLRFHHGSRLGDAIYRTYQDSAMVTQLISVLFLQPVGALLQYAGVLIAAAAFDPRFSLLLLGRAAGAAARRVLQPQAARALPRGARGEQQPDVEHPGEPCGHQGDQGLRPGGLRAGAERAL